MASNKNPRTPRKRPYTLRARARRQQEVHRRITKAAVKLHGMVGPARTTMSDIADLAGVQRATVYNHFPTDFELFDACSSHWFAENPPPDPAAWTEIADPRVRTETALCAMYVYYHAGRRMLENVLRDTPQLPPLQKILQQKWLPLMANIVEILARGWSPSAGDQTAKETGNPELRATLRVTLDFFTWLTLSTSGLSDEQAAHLAAAWVQSSGQRDLVVG